MMALMFQNKQVAEERGKEATEKMYEYYKYYYDKHKD